MTSEKKLTIDELHEEILRLHEIVKTNQESIKKIVESNNALLTKDLLAKLESLNNKKKTYDPYDQLTEWSHNAINQIKKDISESIENNDAKKEKKAQRQADNVDKLLNKVVGLIEKIKKDDLLIEKDNPFYPPSKTFSLRRKYRGARNSLSLLMAGIGLIVLSSGVWEASGELLSIQGRLILGILMVSMTAWLERRKVFALFGQE
ncbi:hypothetical protein C5F47_03425 [Nitrosopumilus cobalaminigenes]|uniref:Uncharacterized protein n=1 Tax=Nitrosopumilus cobalaminigenes TaxID=1470066 RepID=A0A7D5R0M3_9ARCH|nr:hypothetical protein [Nitrosopumilus cobalaminigenes]QLH02677.1 hypothetical protein C5F47_03425 [Nitrosopumilus cobalaminigenes]